jgi:hypothetical protein
MFVHGSCFVVICAIVPLVEILLPALYFWRSIISISQIMKVRELYIIAKRVRAYPQIVYSALELGDIIMSRLTAENPS